MTPEQERAAARIRMRARAQRAARERSTAPQGGAGATIGADVGRAAPNAAQLAEARRPAIRRELENQLGGPMVRLTRPIANLIGDSERRAGVVRATQGFMRDVAEVPNLNAAQLARDTGDAISEGVQGLPGMLGNLVTHLPQVARSMTYGPWADEEHNQRQLELARVMGNQPQVEDAADRANANTANAALNVAGPAAFARPMTALRAGATAAALDAPFALSRNSDQPLQERLPGALTEIGGSGAFGTGAQALVNAGPTISRLFPSRGAQMVDRMDRAGASVDARGAPQQPRGVTPSLATANNGAGVSGAATKMVGDNIVGGVAVRPRVRRALTQTRDAVRDVRDAYGRAQGRDAAGRRLQGAIERTIGERGLKNPRPGTDPLRVPVREWSAASKANAVFDHVLRPIEGNAGRLTNTQAELTQLLQRADSPLVRQFNADSVMSRFRSTVQGLANTAQRGGQGPTLRDLRELRRGVREAQGRVRVGPDSVDNAALQRIEAALTRDIYEAAGSQAPQLQAADRYYARMMNRIDGLRRVVDPNNPAGTFDQIRAAANPRTENTRFLAAVRSALPDDEWRVFVASLIDDMGRPLDGASGFVAEQGFSVVRFATAMRAMSPRARRIIFGSRGGQGGPVAQTMRTLADDLDNLAEVAQAQKGVENSANFSGSGRDAQNFATFGLGVGNLPAAAGLVASLALTGEMLTNPAFVRWLVSARRAGNPSGMRRQLATLRNLATRDPALVPAVAALEAQLQDQQSPPAPASGAGPASTLPQREPAFQ